MGKVGLAIMGQMQQAWGQVQATSAGQVQAMQATSMGQAWDRQNKMGLVEATSMGEAQQAWDKHEQPVEDVQHFRFQDFYTSQHDNEFGREAEWRSMPQ